VPPGSTCEDVVQLELLVSQPRRELPTILLPGLEYIDAVCREKTG
jgi:hypothetical protein